MLGIDLMSPSLSPSLRLAMDTQHIRPMSHSGTRRLEIVTDISVLKQLGYPQETPQQSMPRPDRSTDSEESDTDSLFDEPMESPHEDLFHESGRSPMTASLAEPPAPEGLKPAQRTVPPIPGLYFDPFTLLPDELAEDLLQKCLDTYFQAEGVDQVMLFERVVTESSSGMWHLLDTILFSRCSVIDCNASLIAQASPSLPSTNSGIPQFLKDLLDILSVSLQAILPNATHELLFPLPGTPAQARQVIINLYKPGEGITPHVDLLDRFGDGIIGVSLGSGCVMRFTKVRPDSVTEESNHDHRLCNTSRAWDVFLPHGSVYVMSDEARYGWTHGIDGRREDWVRKSVDSEMGRWVMRSIRVSITFRWLLPGADVVGGL